jgi:integrase
MALAMPKLTRCTKTGDWVSRKVIPADVKDAYQRAHGVRSEALFRAPGNLSPGEAKRLYGDWIGEVESRVETLRGAKKGLGRSLSQKEAHGLSGEWHHWFMGRHEENPGEPEGWDALLDDYIGDYRHHVPKDHNNHVDPHDLWARGPKARTKIRPIIYEYGQVEAFLSHKGIALQPSAVAVFLDVLEPVMAETFKLLQRRAMGDYRPASISTSFPAFDPKRQAGMTAWGLWEAWIAEKRPKAATVDRWRAVFLNLKATFVDRDANSITEDEARKWASGLVTEERSAQTVAEVWVNAAKTIFAWAKGPKHVGNNPFAAIKITVPKKVRHRETQAFRTEELTTLLKATLEPPPPRLATYYAALRRWVPWVCAYTGARAGEITQLRDKDVICQDGVWALRLTPEAGTIKTGNARVVPLHDHLIEQGFLDFVRNAGRGPLFYNAEARRKAEPQDLTKPGQSQAVKSRNKLAEWVRSLGIDDPELSPTHAWRHTFKQLADRNGMSERVSDAITGHSPQTEGRKYGQPTLADMAEALKSFPRYQV